MDDDTRVDATPQEAGKEDVAPKESTGGMNAGDLAGMFGRESRQEDESAGGSVQEDEKPAVESEEDPPADDEEESSLTVEDEEENDDPKEEKEGEAEAESGEDEDDDSGGEPEWFRRRIDKLTAQRKEAEEKLAALEKKLEDRVERDRPPETNVDLITDVKRLEELEKQAQDAEDAFQELLDRGPEYAEDDYDKENPYYKVGEHKWSKEQVLEGRKRARQTYRRIPERKLFVKRQKEAEAEVDKQFSFFSDPEDEYYQFAMESVKGPFYETLSSRLPNAKELVGLMIHGKRDLDRLAKEKKQAKKVAKKTIPSSPPSRAATDTGTAASQRSESESKAKEIKKTLKQGNVSRDALMNMF